MRSRLNQGGDLKITIFGTTLATLLLAGAALPAMAESHGMDTPITYGPRPFYLVNTMEDGDLSDKELALSGPCKAGGNLGLRPDIKARYTKPLQRLKKREPMGTKRARLVPIDRRSDVAIGTSGLGHRFVVLAEDADNLRLCLAFGCDFVPKRLRGGFDCCPFLVRDGGQICLCPFDA